MKTVQIPILQVNTDLNQYNKCSIITPASAANKSGVFQLTPKHLNALANKIGLDDADFLRSAITQAGGDRCELVVTFESVKKGESWVNEKTGETGIFNFDHERILSHEIVLSESAMEYIAGVTREADVLAVREARKARRSRVLTLGTKSVKISDSAPKEVSPKEEVTPEEEGDPFVEPKAKK